MIKLNTHLVDTWILVLKLEKLKIRETFKHFPPSIFLGSHLTLGCKHLSRRGGKISRWRIGPHKVLAFVPLFVRSILQKNTFDCASLQFYYNVVYKGGQRQHIQRQQADLFNQCLDNPNTVWGLFELSSPRTGQSDE